MKNFKVISNYSKKKKLKLIYMALGFLLIALAFIVGIDDNIPGVALLYLGVMGIAFAFVYHWKSIKKYCLLLLGSLIGLPVFTLLHNLFHAIASSVEDFAFVHQLLEALSVITFMTALFICPVGILIGLTGLIAIFIKKIKLNKYHKL